MVISFAYNAI